MRRKNLVLVRAGDSSLHREWIRGCSARNFDVYVSYYGSSHGAFQLDGEYYDAITGFKWPCIAEMFSSNVGLFSEYDAVWFPDDDILADCLTINRMFDLFQKYTLLLAQPALQEGSYLSHEITRRVPFSQLRFTNFVEIMCPIFSGDSLKALGKTFAESNSGWGLDYLWPYLLGYPRDKIAILDGTPVVHTRPVGSGSLYNKCNLLQIKPKREAKKLLRRYGIAKFPRICQYNVLISDSEFT